MTLRLFDSHPASAAASQAKEKKQEVTLLLKKTRIYLFPKSFAGSKKNYNTNFVLKFTPFEDPFWGNFNYENNWGIRSQHLSLTQCVL